MRRSPLARACLRALAATIAAGPAAAAQAGPAAPDTAARATVTGVVFDSLASRPLAGATVIVADSTVVTDAGGRFVARGIAPGRRMVAAFHLALDSLGISPVAVVEVGPGGIADVELASPSFATLWETACGSEASSAPRGIGLVYGSVRDAATGEAISGATAALSWMRVDTASTRLRARRVGLDVNTDASGAYYACGVDLARDIDVSVSAGSARSPQLTATVGERRVARADVMVDRRGGAAGDSRVVGVVKKEDGTPIPGATARIIGTDQEALADSAGRFSLGGIPSGSRMLEVISLGFQAERSVVSLEAGDTASVEVTMKGVAHLPGVTVSARRVSFRRQLMMDRKRLGFGKFISQEEVRQSPSLRTAFMHAPFVWTSAGNPLMGSDWSVMSFGPFGSPCVLNVMIDGRRSDWLEASTLPQHIITDIEVHHRVASMPSELLPPSGNGACGIVLFWTDMTP